MNAVFNDDLSCLFLLLDIQQLKRYIYSGKILQQMLQKTNIPRIWKLNKELEKMNRLFFGFTSKKTFSRISGKIFPLVKEGEAEKD